MIRKMAALVTTPLSAVLRRTSNSCSLALTLARFGIVKDSEELQQVVFCWLGWLVADGPVRLAVRAQSNKPIQEHLALPAHLAGLR